MITQQCEIRKSLKDTSEARALSGKVNLGIAHARV